MVDRTQASRAAEWRQLFAQQYDLPPEQVEEFARLGNKAAYCFTHAVNGDRHPNIGPCDSIAQHMEAWHVSATHFVNSMDVIAASWGCVVDDPSLSSGEMYPILKFHGEDLGFHYEM